MQLFPTIWGKMTQHVVVDVAAGTAGPLPPSWRGGEARSPACKAQGEPGTSPLHGSQLVSQTAGLLL